MAYTASQLITRAYYLSQIVSRNLQVPTADQITDGLYLLNASLDFKNSDLRTIPYFTRSTFNTVVGQEEYIIPNLLYVDTLTFNIGDVRYYLQEKTRYEYFALPRVDNIQSLPMCYRLEREKDGMHIFLYFVPQDTYVMKLSGKFGLTEVTLNTDLTTLYDAFYIEYLRYLLANQICNEFGATTPDGVMRTLQQYEKKILDVSPPDLAIRKQSYFSGAPGWGWQEVNLWKGFLP